MGCDTTDYRSDCKNIGILWDINIWCGHTTPFQRCNNVVDVQTMLYQRQNDGMCLLGRNKKHHIHVLSTFERLSSCFNSWKSKSPLSLDVKHCRRSFSNFSVDKSDVFAIFIISLWITWEIRKRNEIQKLCMICSRICWYKKLIPIVLMKTTLGANSKNKDL